MQVNRLKEIVNGQVDHPTWGRLRGPVSGAAIFEIYNEMQNQNVVMNEFNKA